MTLRSLLCLDYGSGICMRRAPRVLCDQFSESAVQRAHGILKDHMQSFSYNIRIIILHVYVPYVLCTISPPSVGLMNK